MRLSPHRASLTLPAAPHIPPHGSKSYRLLSFMLAGTIVDPFFALMELNMPTLAARVSELRRLGWPVRSLERPHPKLMDEAMTAYGLDGHFRNWLIQNPQQHPSEYPDNDGRMRFASWSKEDYLRAASRKRPAKAPSRS